MQAYDQKNNRSQNAQESYRQFADAREQFKHLITPFR